MPHRLPQAIRAIAAANTPDEILNALAARAGDFGVLCVRHNAKDIWWHQSIPIAFRRAYLAGIEEFGLSTTARQSLSDPLPFTMSDERRRLGAKARGWNWELMHAYGIKDAFICTFGPWVVVFSSTRLLNERKAPSREVRMALVAESAAAVYRFKELMSPKRSPHFPELSTQELIVLQHLAQGERLPTLAKRLELSKRTLETYLKRAQKKLNAKTPIEAVAIAVRHRLI